MNDQIQVKAASCVPWCLNLFDLDLASLPSKCLFSEGHTSVWSSHSGRSKKQCGLPGCLATKALILEEPYKSQHIFNHGFYGHEKLPHGQCCTELLCSFCVLDLTTSKKNCIFLYVKTWSANITAYKCILFAIFWN